MNLTGHPSLLLPDWPAPARVRAAVTLRTGGCSSGPYSSLNLGDHVGDAPAAVARNRQQLAQWLQLPETRIQWLKQVHGIQVVEADPERGVQEADAVTTQQANMGCAVMTADCLPVFFCDRQGSRVAVAHAGWRGLCAGVLEATVATFPNPDEVIAWLGPAIGPDHFEVGADVIQAFVERTPDNAACFVASQTHSDRWLADLYQLARLALQRQGVSEISGGGFCTFSDSARFFSYRRAGQTGRMASLIWLAA